MANNGLPGKRVLLKRAGITIWVLAGAADMAYSYDFLAYGLTLIVYCLLFTFKTKINLKIKRQI